jgi:hypothetical protein
MPAILGLRSPAARRWLPVAVPGLAMLGLGLFEATRPVLSWDEIATADVAHRTAAQIGRLLPHIDGVFGPYYLLLHFWTAVFGASVLSLRLPSILAMAGGGRADRGGGPPGVRCPGGTAGGPAAVPGAEHVAVRGGGSAVRHGLLLLGLGASAVAPGHRAAEPRSLGLVRRAWWCSPRWWR